jgi:hypothetical protein
MTQETLDIPASWADDTNMLTDEELSASSRRVFDEWANDRDDDDIELMDVVVDDQLIFDKVGSAEAEDYCLSPTGPLEELIYTDLNDEKFFAPILTSTDDGFETSAAPLHFDERYQTLVKKLEESMRKSQETRVNLTMKSEKTEEKYLEVLSKTEETSQQLQGYHNMRSNSI